MGVTGLWNLIEDAGTRVDVESLNQKILAIDLSIWINQSIKGFRDRDGRTVENAHLLGLFYRICKLLFYQIKPIVVFDGECPALKLHTVQKRLEKKYKTLEKSKNTSLNVLKNYINSQLTSKENLTVANLREKLNFFRKNFASEIYLPPNNPKQVDVYQSFAELKNDSENCMITDDNDDENQEGKTKNESCFAEKSYYNTQLQNIHDIDINSDQFKSLPLVTRYEILVELRESYKQRNRTCTQLMPQQSYDFSKFQIAKLLKKRNLQEEIEKLINELNGITAKDNIEFLKCSNQINPELFASKSSEITTGILASDEKTRFLLLKTLNNAIDAIDLIVNEDEPIDIQEENSSQNSVYNVPNCLPGQSKIDSDKERIDFLSKTSDSLSQTIFLSKQLSENFDKNYKKYFTTDDNTTIVLSDEDDSSSTNSEDFEEVSGNDDKYKNVFDEFVPYDTSYQLDICVNNEINEKNIKDNDNDNNIKTIKTNDITGKINENEYMKDVEQENVSKLVAIEESTKEKILNDNNVLCSNENENVSDSKISHQKNIEEEIIKDSKESIKLNRQAATVNNQMITECQELLRLFGIPWIVAPAEAEAQCAILEDLGLCEGIITDDSDIFLFGGKNVYRNFFTNSKYIMRYNIEDLKKYYGLDRSKFICLGMLCGTDYTFGIDGVGPVTAMEILSQFPGEGLLPLEKFSQWYHHKLFVSKDERPENSVRAKFLKFSLPSTFPSRVIFDAYYNANVDNSMEPFSWSMPQLSELRQYTLERFGWSEAKTDAFLLPVLKNLNSKQSQKKIDLYFTSLGTRTSNNISEKLKIKRSKRLNEAIRKNIKLITQQQNDDKHNFKKERQRKRRNKIANCDKLRRPTVSTTSDKITHNLFVLSEESSCD